MSEDNNQPGTPTPAPSSFDEKKDASPESTNLIKGIVSTNTSGPDENFLDVAPEVDMTLLRDVTPQNSILLLILKIFLVLLLVAWASAFAFFTSQLSDVLDPVTSKLDVPNASQDLEASNAEIIELQTDLNFYRYLQLKANLDQLSFHGDDYVTKYDIANSQTASNSEKNEAEADIEGIKQRLREVLLSAQTLLGEDLSAPITTDTAKTPLEVLYLFQTKLKDRLNAKAVEVSGGDDVESRRANRNYLQTIELIGNAPLKTIVLNTDFDDLSDEEIYNFIKDLNEIIVNDMSSIQEIKSKRIKWSDIINEIELRTIAVDSHYDSTDLFQDVGGIRYVSYDFSSDNRSIAIAGETKLFTTLNFSLIADLIDELNRSEFFENAEMRSFTKSGSVAEGYVASLRLNLNLEEDEEEAVVEETSIDELPDLGIEL